MAYSDAPRSRWDLIAGCVACLVVGLILFDPLGSTFVFHCISHPCFPSLEWRLLALIVVTFSLGAVPGWIVAKLVNRLVRMRPEVRSGAVRTTIYMPLLNEGTDVWRPVTAEEVGNGRYRLVDDAPDDEEWCFVSAVVVVDSHRRIIAAEGSNGR